jgi:hypothetical protein
MDQFHHQQLLCHYSGETEVAWWKHKRCEVINILVTLWFFVNLFQFYQYCHNTATHTFMEDVKCDPFASSLVQTLGSMSCKTDQWVNYKWIFKTGEPEMLTDMMSRSCRRLMLKAMMVIYVPSHNCIRLAFKSIMLIYIQSDCCVRLTLKAAFNNPSSWPTHPS